MKLKLTAPKSIFIKKLKINDSIQDKRLLSLYNYEIDVKKVAGEFQTLTLTLYREWPYILNVIKTLSKSWNTISYQELLKSNTLDVLKDINGCESLVDSNVHYAYMQLYDFYRVVCIPKNARKFINPEIKRCRDYVVDSVSCGYIPDFLYLFDYRFNGTNSDYFKLQTNIFEFFNTLALKKISFEVSHYFPREIVARKI